MMKEGKLEFLVFVSMVLAVAVCLPTAFVITSWLDYDIRQKELDVERLKIEYEYKLRSEEEK